MMDWVAKLLGLSPDFQSDHGSRPGGGIIMVSRPFTVHISLANCNLRGRRPNQVSLCALQPVSAQWGCSCRHHQTTRERKDLQVPLAKNFSED
jgi:hypothetical protein